MGENGCTWYTDDPVYTAYHDTEWGVPEWDARALWEKLTLDGFQAGLSWITILKKRSAFREAFDGFQPEIVAAYSEKDIERLLSNAGIVRHRGKIEAAIGNAQAYLKIQENKGFDTYLWDFVGGEPIVNAFRQSSEIPAQTELSQRLSKDLQKRGFRFCGPTIVYAFMQAVGMVNDHLVSCPRHVEVNSLNRQ